jgi:hypothetical protein
MILDSHLNAHVPAGADQRNKDMPIEPARKQRERIDREKQDHSEKSRESQPSNQGGNRGEIDANKDRRQGGERSNQTHEQHEKN